MSFPTTHQKRIDEIRNDFTNGSSVIAGNTLKILADALNEINESENKIILELAQELLSAKPHMAAPTNILKIFINKFPNLSNKSEIRNFIKKLESEMQSASEICINLALEKLFNKENTSVLTCSYSSTLFNIIANASNRVSVYILHSIWNGIDYSEIWQEKLSVLNVKCYMLSKNDTIPNIDFALIGADAILNSGDIINGVPSLYLAQSIKKIGIPLYVVAESFKKCKEIPVKDGFDFIPNELITDIITDNNFLAELI